MDKSSKLAGPQFGPNEDNTNSIILQDCLGDQICWQSTWECRKYSGNDDDEAGQAERPPWGPVTRSFFARLSYGGVELRTDMHTHRLVHKVEILSEVAIPKKAMNQFWMLPLRPLQKRRVHVGVPYQSLNLPSAFPEA